ncbi:alpha/beta hydrolase [Candidatus Saccharibacteria bacterium]|nr:alpha/beta hydrolase [Candidatus Saccharibacteria bacterium]
MTNEKYFIIHGSFGSSSSNWIPFLKEEIKKRRLEVYTPDFPIGVGRQSYESWSRLLKTYLDEGKLNGNTTIFAHSIAPVFVCKFLIENQVKVKRLVFVCGFNNYLGINEEYDSVNKSMFTDELSGIKKYCDDIICYYSDNDPYVPFEVEKDFADAITAKQHVIENGGHLNSESGYTEFEDLTNYI